MNRARSKNLSKLVTEATDDTFKDARQVGTVDKDGFRHILRRFERYGQEPRESRLFIGHLGRSEGLSGSVEFPFERGLTVAC